jgi:hypothetical protein
MADSYCLSPATRRIYVHFFGLWLIFRSPGHRSWFCFFPDPRPSALLPFPIPRDVGDGARSPRFQSPDHPIFYPTPPCLIPIWRVFHQHHPRSSQFGAHFKHSHLPQPQVLSSARFVFLRASVSPRRMFRCAAKSCQAVSMPRCSDHPMPRSPDHPISLALLRVSASLR